VRISSVNLRVYYKGGGGKGGGFPKFELW